MLVRNLKVKTEYMNLKNAIFVALVFLISHKSFAQSNLKQSLIVVHVQSVGGKGKSQFKQKIFSYHFLNGSFVGRDELLSVDGKKDGKDYIRTDNGQNTIYKDRYLITGIGNIIDLVDKTVLFDGKAGLIRCSNDSAIFYTNDLFKGKFYSIYDFNAKQYREVKDQLFKPKFGRDVEYDKIVSPFKINYYPQGKPKVVLCADAGYGQQGIKNISYVPDPPMYWIDNSNFLFSYFNKDNTELSFYKINVDTKASILVGKIAMSSESDAATLSVVSSDQLIMRLGNKQVFIDLKNNLVNLLDFTKPVYGFSYETKADSKGRSIKLNGKDLGKFHFESRNFMPGENIAAFVKEMVLGSESYQQGLSVWNYGKQGWQSVDADEVLTLVGWIKE